MHWRQAAHEYLVKKFLSSPNFHRMVHRVNGTQMPQDDRLFSAIERRQMRALKRKAYWNLFKDELKYEFFPWR